MKAVPRTIDAAVIEIIALGSAVLGAGGGGDPYIGRLMAQQAVGDCGPVQLVDPDDVPDDAFVFLVGMIGAPAVIVEKLPSGNESVQAVNALSMHVGKRITHIGCIEAGGLNSMVPIAAAAHTGLPLINADGMGRAFPELQMLIPTLDKISATPMALIDEKGNSLILDTVDNKSAETFARTAAIKMGASATMALYPLTGAHIRSSLVPRTYSMAYRIGSAILEARAAHDDAVERVATELRGEVIFSGKAVDLKRRTTAGFNRGEVHFEGFNNFTGHSLCLDFQNEFLIAKRDGETLTTTPDLICVVDAQSAEPITAEALRYGQRVSVIAAPCYNRWRSEAGLRIVGPHYFGFASDYVPFKSSDRTSGAS